MNPFEITKIYQILTTDDSLYSGMVNQTTGDEVTLQLTTESDYFFTDDVVTLNLNQIIAYIEVPQNE